MSRLIYVFVAALFVSSTQAYAAVEAVPGDCEMSAVGKDGKPLSGSAKKSAIKKCEAAKKDPAAMAKPTNAANASCEDKAVSKKSGKKLSGAAKQKFMEKCLRDAP